MTQSKFILLHVTETQLDFSAVLFMIARMASLVIATASVQITHILRIIALLSIAKYWLPLAIAHVMMKSTAHWSMLTFAGQRLCFNYTIN